MGERRLSPFFFLPRCAVVLVLFSLCQVEGTLVPAMYVFGDSTADVGNNNFLPGGASTKANYPYNGIDYPGSVATGRFSNGYNGVDYIARWTLLPQSPPAALSVTGVLQELFGVNYASGGSGILDATSENVSLSMNEQVDLFRKTVDRLEKLRGKAVNDLLLRRSLFAFSTGNNDLFDYFLRTGAGNQTQNDDFVASLAATFRAQLKSLYDVGARKFGVFSIGQLGCPPALRRLTPAGDCIQALNDLARAFNVAVADALRDLQSASPGMKYSVADSYEISSAVLANPGQYGISEVRSACCGSGVLNAETFCTTAANLCPDRRRYLYWDYTHPTQIGYSIFADYAFEGSRRFASPVNFLQLALS